MDLECYFSALSSGIPRIGFAVYKALFHGNVGLFFQGLEVAGEVAICYFQQVPQPGEIHMVIHHKHRHYAQADTVVKAFVDAVYESQGRLLFIVFEIHHTPVEDVEGPEAYGP